MKRLLGIGNALVDMLIHIDYDQELINLGLPKGSMTLVDRSTIRRILTSRSLIVKRQTAGGSAANTIHGAAQLGIPAAFIGKVGDDELGKLFYRDMQTQAITTFLKTGKQESGVSCVLISADSERTFATCLGAAADLSENDLASTDFTASDVLHLEGYLVINQALVKKALAIAKEHKMTVSLDLASYNVVAANLPFLQDIVRHQVDIVFANEEEAAAFTGGLHPESALKQMADMCSCAIVKIGSKGSFIKQADHLIHIPAISAHAIDTTGAGDLYASGFLAGYCLGKSLETCGRLGSLLAGKVVEVIGPKMSAEQWQAIKGIITEEIDQ
jgi:sugar/nucleoside kinase (ribokinase family)